MSDYTAAEIEDDFVGERITAVEYTDGEGYAQVIVESGRKLDAVVEPTWKDAPEEDGHKDD